MTCIALVKMMNWMIYHLWLARNDARETQSIADSRTIVSRLVASVEEWKSIQNPPRQKAPTSKEHWLPPEENWVKVNTDGAFHLASRTGGEGVSFYKTTMTPSCMERVVFPLPR
jgi:hypothetical protein